MIALCGGIVSVGRREPSASEAWNGCLGKTWGVSVARYCVLRERGVVDDDAFVVIHTRLVPLGFAEERFHPLPLWVFCLALLISLLAFHKSRMFSLCSGSRLLFVHRCSMREDGVIFRDRPATCRALCA